MENYIGNELDLFENATNWKKYYTKILKKYIFGNVVEVGAGMGGTTSYLQNNNVQSWVCLEPDIKLCSLIKKKTTLGEIECRPQSRIRQKLQIALSKYLIFLTMFILRQR